MAQISDGKKRQNVIEWDDYFMGIAFLARHRSKDPDYQAGACVVTDDKKVIGIGYNGFPLNISDDKAPWDKKEKHFYVCHAERNAIYFGDRTQMKGSTMYATLSPCNECAKTIIQVGIKKVIYFSDEKMHKKEFSISAEMFGMKKQKTGENGVEFVKFSEIDRKPPAQPIEFTTVNLKDEVPVNIKLCVPK